MQPKIEVTREDALDSINRIKEMRLFLPLFKVGSAYIIDEAEFFFYDYTPEQKKDLWTVAIALSGKLIDANDFDVEAINKNASNMNEEFKNSFQSMFHASRNPSKDSSGVEEPNNKLKGVISSLQKPIKELKNDSFDKTPFIIPLELNVPSINKVEDNINDQSEIYNLITSPTKKKS